MFFSDYGPWFQILEVDPKVFGNWHFPKDCGTIIFWIILSMVSYGFHSVLNPLL
jgi:hypothetical protein